jgi:eukaryotic-like serine/threonine-protein kinase
MDNIAHYHILDRIGAGGMGEVFRARDTRLGRTVAIKVLPDVVARDPERRERFLREARASAALSHPNICALFEIGEEADRLFLVFEFVPGETLRQTIDGRPLNVRTAVDIAVQLADALADAHGAAIIHRDIKPENIIITPKGHPKILDFGLASFTESGTSRETAATELKTAEGVALGTLAYMSPEQALGVGCDHRTDIFSLGAVLYETLTGTSPFKAPTPAATALKVLQATPAPPSTLNRNVPAELDAIVAHALSKDPNQRYQSVAAMAAELRSLGAILDVREAVALERPAPARRRSFRPAIAAAVLLILLAGGLWLARAPLGRMRARWFGPAPTPVLAVVPLELIGGDQSRVYFADGLTDDMITRLGQVPGLKVLGRSATRDFRGRAPAEVAAELHAAVVLTGAVQSAGDDVKVNVELLDPKDGTQIWSGNYQRSLSNIFAVQTEIAEDVARSLSVTLAPSAARARTAARQVNAAAYDLYLRGRDAAARRDVDRAIELYRQAIQSDLALAEAHAGLAEAIHLRGVFQGQFSPALSAEMRRAAMNAAASDPDLPQAELAIGLTEPAFAESLKHFRRAIELDPSYSEAFHQIGDALMAVDPERATAFYRRAIALDPRAVIAYADMAFVYANGDRFAEAEAELRHLDNNPFNIAASARAIIAMHRNQPAEAVRVFEGPARMDEGARRAFKVGTPMTPYISALRQAGDAPKAVAEAEALVTALPDDCEANAMLAALREESGDRRGAHALADRFVQAAMADDASLTAMRCGPFAAAALADAGSAGAMLTRIAESEERLRRWTLHTMGSSGDTWLRRAWYPFNRVADHPPVPDARTAIAKALLREREIASPILAGLLERSAEPASARE